jgi:hypothetical protein
LASSTSPPACTRGPCTFDRGACELPSFVSVRPECASVLTFFCLGCCASLRCMHRRPSLVALQVTMPNLSLLGHLSGILTGTLQSGRGGGRAGQSVFAPSFETLARIEQSGLCQRMLSGLVARFGYVPVPASAPSLYSAASQGRGGARTALSVAQIGAGRMRTRCTAGCRAASRALVGRDVPHDHGDDGGSAGSSVRRLGDEWRRLLARLAHALVHRPRSARRSPHDASSSVDDEEHGQLLLVETITTTPRTEPARHRRSDQDGSETGEDDGDATDERDVAFV